VEAARENPQEKSVWLSILGAIGVLIVFIGAAFQLVMIDSMLADRYLPVVRSSWHGMGMAMFTVFAFGVVGPVTSLTALVMITTTVARMRHRDMATFAAALYLCAAVLPLLSLYVARLPTLPPLREPSLLERIYLHRLPPPKPFEPAEPPRTSRLFWWLHDEERQAGKHWAITAGLTEESQCYKQPITMGYPAGNIHVIDGCREWVRNRR
jgi:hypothetical protein